MLPSNILLNSLGIGCKVLYITIPTIDRAVSKRQGKSPTKKKKMNNSCTQKKLIVCLSK